MSIEISDAISRLEVTNELARCSRPLTVEISLSDGRLYGDMDGRGKEPLVAQSQTLFSGLYGLGVEFFTDSQGAPTHLFVKHVSGDYKFAPRR